MEGRERKLAGTAGTGGPCALIFFHTRAGVWDPGLEFGLPTPRSVPCASVSSLGGSGRGCISIDGRWGAVLTAQGSGRGRGRGGGVERIRLGEQG